MVSDAEVGFQCYNRAKAVMAAESGRDVTVMLRAWAGGDRAALDNLIPLLRLVDAKQAGWRDRAHFLAVCSQIMRRTLVDHARARRSDKRGGGLASVTLDKGLAVSSGVGTDVVAVDYALTALSKIDPRKGRVVWLVRELSREKPHG